MLWFTLLTIIFVVGVNAAPKPEDRIVGGSDARAGEYPYIVSLKVPTSHSCGGSIINEKYILTAAHCVYGSEQYPERLKIQYGVLDINSKENMVDVIKVIRHEKYSPGGGYYNDVAILELAEDIVFGANAQPVQLPSSTDYPGDNATAILVGWGRNATSISVLNHLQKVQIVLFANDFCEMKEPNYNRNFHVCAGVPPGGKGQCSGDSGGPLTVDGKQYGVVSWSVKPCTSPGHPGIFAKVTQYRDWIREHTGV